MTTCPELTRIIDAYNHSTTRAEAADWLRAYDTHRDGCRVCTTHAWSV